MAKIYGYKRFNNPEAMRVNLSAKMTVTEAAGSTDNPDFDTVNGIGRNDVGSIVKVTAADVGSILANKAAVDLASGTYYVLAEVPSAADATDFYFVGVIIKSQYDVDNLIERTTQMPWADQFYHLRTRGVR